MQRLGYVLFIGFVVLGCASSPAPSASRAVLPARPVAVSSVPEQVSAPVAWSELLEDAGGCLRYNPADFACAMELGVGLSLAIRSDDASIACSALEWTNRYTAGACSTQHVMVREEILRQADQLIAVCDNAGTVERARLGIARDCEPGEGNFIDDVATRHDSLRARWAETLGALEHADVGEWFVLQRRLATIYLTVAYLGEPNEMLAALREIAAFARYTCESQDRWARAYIHAAFMRIGDGFRDHPYTRAIVRHERADSCMYE